MLYPQQWVNYSIVIIEILVLPTTAYNKVGAKILRSLREQGTYKTKKSMFDLTLTINAIFKICATRTTINKHWERRTKTLLLLTQPDLAFLFAPSQTANVLGSQLKALANGQNTTHSALAHRPCLESVCRKCEGRHTVCSWGFKRVRNEDWERARETHWALVWPVV